MCFSLQIFKTLPSYMFLL
jgi:hypothetical protein